MPSAGNLSYFVELLRTIEWGADKLGSNYVPGGSQQVIVRAFPPLTSVNLSMAPGNNAYAYIFYSAGMSPAMQPDVFAFNHTAWGSTVMSGVFTSIMMGFEYAIFVPVTEAHTVRITITNLTPLFQYFELDYKFLVIQNQTYYQHIVEVLDQKATSAKSENALVCIKELLEGAMVPKGST